MIAGIGIDVVDIPRFASKIETNVRLRERLFVPEERLLSMKSLAARFAAKEAFAKALGAPAGLCWQDAWVKKNIYGAPYFEYSGTVSARVAELKIRQLELSMSHDGVVATAIVIAVV